MKTLDIQQATVRVLVVDDQKPVRQNLKLYLESNSQIEVVALAGDGVAALEKIAELEPDVAIIDWEMPGIDGIRTIEIINKRFPQTKTLVLSSHEQKKYIHQAIVAGANGYLMKGSSEEQLTEAVLKIYQGYFKLDAKLADKISLNFKGELEVEDITIDTNKIDFLPTAIEASEKSTEATSEDLTAMRQEIVDILEGKINSLESQKNKINLSFQELQRKFSWLLASQLVLLFMVVGSTSSMLKMKQQTATNMQNDNAVKTSQLIK